MRISYLLPCQNLISPTTRPFPAVLRTVAVAALLGSFVCLAPAYAADGNVTDTSQNVMTPSPQKKHTEHSKKDQSPEAMAAHVEARIQTLHDKLSVTDVQESKWNDVAQAMRDNETALSQLIQTRHQNPEAMSAVDDLQSYETITQAHADGLKKLIPAFQALYNDMSDTQKESADKLFRHFEGHGDTKKHA